MTIDVSIVYVNWNSSGEIIESVKSIRRFAGGCKHEILVVDNASGENLDALEREPDINVIRSPKNGGFGSGCNIGAREALGKYLLFLNPDTVLESDVPGILFSFLESHPDAGAAGGKLLNEDGTVNYNGGRRFHCMLNDFLEHSSLCFKYPKIPVIGRPYYGNWDHNSTRTVDSLCGACMMFRKDAFDRLGGFDEAFFMYCEEVDLCLRTWRAGHKIHYVHEAVMLHKGCKSSEQYFAEFTDIVLQFLDSEAKYFAKHFRPLYCRIWRKGVGVIYWLKYKKNKRQGDLRMSQWGFKRV